MKAIEKHFPVVLSIMLYNLVLTFESVDEISSATIQMKATEQNFLVVLFVVLYAGKSYIVAVQIIATEQFFPLG